MRTSWSRFTMVSDTFQMETERLFDQARFLLINSFKKHMYLNNIFIFFAYLSRMLD